MPPINAVSSSANAAALTPIEIKNNSLSSNIGLKLPTEIKLDLGRPNSEPQVLTDLYQKIQAKLTPGLRNPNTTDQGTVKLTAAETKELFDASLKALGDVPLGSLSTAEQQFFSRATGKPLDPTTTTLKDAITSALGNQVNEFRQKHPGVAEAAVFAYIATTKDVSILNKLGVLPAKFESNSTNVFKDDNGSITTNQNLNGQIGLDANNKFNLSAGFKREEIWQRFNQATGKTGFELKASDVLNNPTLQANLHTEQTDKLPGGGTYQTSADALAQYNAKTGGSIEIKGATDSLSVVKKGEQTTTLTEKFNGQLNANTAGSLNLQAGFNRQETVQNPQATRRIETNASLKADNLLVSPKLQANASYNQTVADKNGNSNSFSVSGGLQTGSGQTAAQLQVEAKSTRVAEHEGVKTTLNETTNGQIDYTGNKLNALGQYNRQRIVSQGDLTLGTNNLTLGARGADLLGAPTVGLSARYEQKRGDTSFFVGGQAQIIPTPQLQKVEAGYQHGALTVGAEYTPQNGLSGSIGLQEKLRNGGGQEIGSYRVKLEANQREVKATVGLEAKF